jgi:Effector Associated Constant Component 1
MAVPATRSAALVPLRPVTNDLSTIMASMTPSVRIAVDGDEMPLLREWLNAEPELRGRVTVAGGEAAPDEMGVVTELVVAVGAAVPMASVLARTVTTWLVQRRSDVTLTITGADGKKITVNAKRVKDAEALIRDVLESGDSS